MTRAEQGPADGLRPSGHISSRGLGDPISTPRPAPHPRMRRPDRKEHFRSLLVADIDLDHGQVTTRPILSAEALPHEGVYATVWRHGEPIGEITVTGQPEEMLPALPRIAAERLTRARAAHAVRDALSGIETLGMALSRGLDAVPHPTSGTSAPIPVTVVVCTRDRPDQLRECLASLAELADSVVEVLVVDNASAGPDTRSVAAEFPFTRYVREPRKGLDWARNRGLLEATTPIVAFTDDDVIVHPTWVDGLLRAFSDEPSAVAVTGLVVPAELSTPAQVLFEAWSGFGRGYERRYFSAAVEHGEVAAARHAGVGRAGTGANMAFRRDVLLELGGFDTALDVGTPTGGGGDLEMFFRVIAAGHLLVYEPSAVVRHRHRPTVAAFLRQKRGDGTGSYSWWLGAGSRYGPRQRRAFARFAVLWFLRGHVRGVLRSVRRPRSWPPAVTYAELRGAVDAVLGRYYREAMGQARSEAELHPDEPAELLVVRAPARGRSRDERSAGHIRITVAELAGMCPSRTLASKSARELTVEMVQGETVLLRVVLRSDGAEITASRLRWAIATQLGASDRLLGRIG